MGRHAINLTGMRVGWLTVVERVENDKHGQARWLCQCACGKRTVVLGASLRRGVTRSCGCLNRELAKKRTETHGSSGDRLYGIWKDMKKRCNNPNKHTYKYYGGRGIRICEEWDHSFAAFQEWALHSGYEQQLTIDRIDVNGNYCPENCRWTDWKTQCNNKRNSLYLTYKGEKKTIAEWENVTGLQAGTIYQRIKKLGWNVERALETPPQKQNKKNC